MASRSFPRKTGPSFVMAEEPVELQPERPEREQREEPQKERDDELAHAGTLTPPPASRRSEFPTRRPCHAARWCRISSSLRRRAGPAISCPAATARPATKHAPHTPRAPKRAIPAAPSSGATKAATDQASE
jgi:hypothetical protein